MIAKIPELFDKCVLWAPLSGSSVTTTAKTITANGNATQVSFPINGSGIANFDGASDYVSITDWYSSGCGTLFSGDFTIEFNVRFSVTGTIQRIIGQTVTAGTTFWQAIYHGTQNQIIFNRCVGGTYTFAYACSFTPVAGTWYHIALERMNSVWYILINGVAQTVTISNAYSGDTNFNAPLTIGDANTIGEYSFNGQLSEVRISSGYRYAVSPFTPQRTPFTPDANTKLLLHFKDNSTSFVDSSPSNHQITAYGNAHQLAGDPWGLSRPVGYFDGNGDYLTHATATNFNFLHNGTTPWTISFWYYPLSWASGSYAIILDTNATSTGVAGILLRVSNSGVLALQMTRAVAASYVVAGSATSPLTLNTWNYVTVRWDYSLASANVEIYINGAGAGTLSKTGNAVATSNCSRFWIGAYEAGDATYSIRGYVSEFKISSKWEPYTVPTTRSKPDSYTKLLLHMYGSGSTFTDDPFVDYDEFPILPSGVTATPNGTFTKTDLGNNKSVLNFDGSTNYISLTDNDAWNFGSGDFTISFWMIVPSIPTARYILWQQTDTNNLHGISIQSGNGVISQVYQSSYQWQVGTGPGTISINNWYHVTFVRSGNTQKIYLNGIQTGNTATSSATLVNYTGNLFIGYEPNNWGTPSSYHNGNLAHLMIWKGRALSQPEIKLLMNRTHPITGAGLLPGGYDYWRG